MRKTGKVTFTNAPKSKVKLWIRLKGTTETEELWSELAIIVSHLDFFFH